MKKNISIRLIILFVAIVILISACSSNGQIGNGRRQRFQGNLTEEQKQQNIEARMKSMAQVCENKSEGDMCKIKSQRGDRTGLCKAQDGKLFCSFKK